MLSREDGVSEIVQKYSALVSKTPELTSLLYDIDMLPEQTVTLAGAIRLAGLCEVWKRYEANEATIANLIEAAEQALGALKALGAENGPASEALRSALAKAGRVANVPQ